MPELWVIEAPGKARPLEGILARLGLDAKVQATKGHLVSMPDKLSPLGIDSGLHDFLREPRDIEVAKRLRAMAAEADRVVIATDADQEGDVIAWDVFEMIGDLRPGAVRARLRGMDDESVREAIEQASPVRKEDAVPGRTRAIVDRLIGATFSANGVAVGRVGTALLGLVRDARPSVDVLRLSAPAKDGGRPWLAECPVRDPVGPAVAARVAAMSLPALDAASSEAFTAAPGHMGDIMVRAADKLDLSPAETAKAMQRTYEGGKLSYPRASSRGMSRVSALKMKRLLAKIGSEFDETVVADKAAADVHDAPHPIGPVDLSLDPRKMGADEGVRAMIARDLVRSGQRHRVEKALGWRIEAFLVGEGIPAAAAALIAGLDWRREQGPRYPGQESWGKSEVARRRPDAVLLEAAMAAGLGRPSTWANHVEGFLKRGLVDDSLALTAKGLAWIEASPKCMLDPRLSVAIERACEKIGAAPPAEGREPWESLAARIVRALPAEIQGPVRAATDMEAPRPRRDFKALASPGLDIDALLAAPAYAPAYAPPDA